jgi:hypothetical protein
MCFLHRRNSILVPQVGVSISIMGMQVVQAALAKRRDTPVLFISSHSHSTLLSKGVDGNRWPVLRYVFKRLTRRRGLDVIHENMRTMSATVGSDTLEITMGKASLKICHLAAAY